MTHGFKRVQKGSKSEGQFENNPESSKRVQKFNRSCSSLENDWSQKVIGGKKKWSSKSCASLKNDWSEKMIG
jgi:hypothetical protein